MSLILCTIPFQKSGIMIGNICWTDPVPKGLYKESYACTVYIVCNWVYSAPNCEQCTHAHQQMVCKAIYEHLYLLSFCTFCTFRIFDGKDAERGLHSALASSHILPLWGRALRRSTTFISKKFSSDSPRAGGKVQSGGETWNRTLFGSDTLQREQGSGYWSFCLCCHCCCLCFQMAFRSSRKLVHNVQVFQVELPPKLWPHPRQSLSRSIYPTLPIRGTCCNLERI